MGLEIKREFVVGELVDLKRTAIVVMGAIGGVVFPILFYLFFNHSSNAFHHGWAIPIATDTAIAIGIMSLFKNRLPKGVFPFMAALAVLDDIVAISIIALFYTDGIQLIYVLLAIVVTVIMMVASIAGVRNALFYFFSGLVLWCMFEFSGIHAVIAGVIIAFTIPARPKDKPHIFVTKSIFVSDLAFTNANYVNIAKLSIVISSIVAAISASYIIHKTR